MVEAAERKMMPYVRDEIKFYQHQVDGIRKMARMKSVILADDMGLGKSVQALVTFLVDVVMGYSQTCLVICPTSLKGNWADEIEKFTVGVQYVVLNGTPVQRTKQLIEFSVMNGPKILIVNYEQVVRHKAELNALYFDIKIMDEAHYIKNYKSQRTKAVHAILAKRKLLLTGTPLLNHVNELWSLFHEIDPNRWPKYWSFVNRYCVFGGYEEKQIIGVKNEKELREILDDFMIRRLKSEVLDLPEVQIIEKRVDLLPEQRKLYTQAINELELPLVGQADPVEIENALVKFTRLKQICGTTLPFIGKDISAKLDVAIEDDIQLLLNDEKIVVFTQSRSTHGAYCDRMKPFTVFPVFKLTGDVKPEDRQGIVNDWSNTTGPAVLVCMLQVAGVGLNMTAARHGSFLDELFTPGLNQQAIDRLHRIGQSTAHPVQIRKYIARNTIEQRVAEILSSKTKIFKNVIETDPDFKQKLYAAIMEAA